MNNIKIKINNLNKAILFSLDYGENEKMSFVVANIVGKKKDVFPIITDRSNRLEGLKPGIHLMEKAVLENTSVKRALRFVN